MHISQKVIKEFIHIYRIVIKSSQVSKMISGFLVGIKTVLKQNALINPHNIIFQNIKDKKKYSIGFIYYVPIAIAI